jgi:hypothetical protein
LAPFDTEIFLELVDQKIASILKKYLDEGSLIIMRFVDDYLVMYKEEFIQQATILKAFDESKRTLTFTKEEETENGLQFLEIRISTSKGVCWECQQRDQKPLLPYKSNHSKSIKNAIVVNALKSARSKKCPCKILSLAQKDISTKRQRQRLQKAGYPSSWINRRKSTQDDEL